jgi:hypothetical protein
VLPLNAKIKKQGKEPAATSAPPISGLRSLPQVDNNNNHALGADPQSFAGNLFKMNYAHTSTSMDSRALNESAVQLLHLAHLAGSAFANVMDHPDDDRSASPNHNNNCNSMMNLNLAMAASKPFRVRQSRDGHRA